MVIQLFWTFFKIGLFTIGGGYVMLPFIQKEVVDRHHWIEESEFYDMIALAQAAPGVFAINTAIFIGHRLGGWKGIIACILGAALPSIVIILLIAMCLTGYKDHPTIEAIFRGIRPAVVAMIVAAVVRMIRNL